MIFTSTALTFLALITTAISTPAPAPAAGLKPSTDFTKADSIAYAESLGIDVYGPIPDDAVREDTGKGGWWVAKEGSLAWAWMRAQVDLPDTKATRDEIIKRQGYANIGIGLWAQDNCQGEGRYTDNVIYGTNYYTNVNMFSVGISYRGTRNNEQLDFSRYQGSDACGRYLYSAGRNTPAGCFNSQLVNCFRLWIN